MTDRDPRDATIARLSADLDLTREALGRAEHITKMTQRSRRHASEQWAQAGRDALAGKPQNMLNRIELQSVAIAAITRDETDGGPLIALDDRRLATIDAELAMTREALDRCLALDPDGARDVLAKIAAKVE